MFDARYNLVLVPATKHSILRRWLARPRLCTAGRDPLPSRRPVVRRHERAVHGCRPRAGRLFCLTGLTNGQPGCSEYYAVQNEKLKKYRLGLPEGEENEAVGKLIAELEHLSKS